MPRPSIRPILLFWLAFVVGGTTGVFANTTDSTVEFPEVIHFLTPAGDDVEVGPGMYQVQAAESWLKLLPDGEGPASAILVEATVGEHEEQLTEARVRLEPEAENSDVFHLAMLLTDGTGLEALGTGSGIRPRALNLAFLTKRSRTASMTARAQRLKRPTESNTQLAPLQPQGQKSCGPVHAKIPRSNGKFHKPEVAVHQNQLFILAPVKYDCKRSFCGGLSYSPRLLIFNGKNWARKKTDGVSLNEDSRVALASFQNRLHLVFVDEDKKDLHHWILNGSQWEPGVFPKGLIPDQKSKAAPALAVLGDRLHMVHLGKSSNTLWHSIYEGRRWTPNAPIPNQKSQATPAMVAEPNRIHMAYLNDDSDNLMHTQFTGHQWTSPFFVKGGGYSAKSNTTPALTYNGQIEARLQLMFPDQRSPRLRSVLYGIPEGSAVRQAKWFDERNLMGLSGEKPLSAIFYQGCVHMVYQRNDDTLGHSTFAPEDVHPSVR